MPQVHSDVVVDLAEPVMQVLLTPPKLAEACGSPPSCMSGQLH